MMNSYLITRCFITANRTGIMSPQNSMQKYKQYTTAKQKSEQFNDSSNTALTARLEIVVKKLWYSKCRANGHLFGQCSSSGLQFNARIKNKFAIKVIIIYIALTSKPTIQASKQYTKYLTICLHYKTYYLPQSVD